MVETLTDSGATQRPRGAARREALLEAVLEIVAAHGADAVTHRRVAQVAQLPLASTTYWFDSKDELLTAAFQLAAERDVARLREQLEHHEVEQDPLELAVEMLAACGDAPGPGGRSSLLATYAMLLEAARRPELQGISRRWTDAYLQTIGELLAAAGSQRPRDDAELLLALCDGLLLEQLSSGAVTDLPARLRRAAHALLEAR